MAEKRPVGRPRKNPVENNNNENKLGAMSIEELEALRDKTYDEWEGMPKGIAKASKMSELQDIETALETARNKVESGGGISASQMESIVNKAVQNALADAMSYQNELIAQVRDLTSVMKTQAQEIASLKADIASLKSSHAKQLSDLKQQITSVQTSADMISADVKKGNKKKAEIQVQSDTDKITIQVPRTGGVDVWEKKLIEAAEQEARKTRIEEINNALQNVSKGKYSGVKFDDLDADMQKRLTELRDYNGSDNYIYDFIKDNQNALDDSIIAKQEEIERQYEAEAPVNPDINDIGDLESFEEIANG